MRHSLALLFIISLLGCRHEPPVRASVPSPVPKQVTAEQAKEQALAAFEVFEKSLKEELLAALKEGGPVKAVEVCQGRAPEIASSVSQQQGIDMGRSSHRLRNQSNEPSEELRSYLVEHAEKPASQATVKVLSSENEWTVIAPIATQALCLTCHGDPKSFSPELNTVLRKYYPDDKATGFEVGDLRGVFWARVPKQAEESLEGAIPGTLPLNGSASRKIKTH